MERGTTAALRTTVTARNFGPDSGWRGGVRNTRNWLFVAAGLVLAATAIAWGRRTSVEPTVRRPRPVADSLLNIPLAQTVLPRQEFLKEYRGSEPQQRAALYEKFLPLIGANGIRQELQTAHPICHDEAHDLGRLIFAKLRDVGASLESCADACSSGCMHGVLMQFFTDSGSTGAPAPQHSAHQHSAQLTAADVAGRIPTFCESPALMRMYGPGDCAHGVGHAVMFLSNYDIDAGIDLCERFPSYPLRYYCATGAYMEYRGNPRSRLDFWNHGGVYPCDKVRYPAACFRYVLTETIRWYYVQGGTLETLARQCMGFSAKYRLGCFHGMGFAHMIQVTRGRRTLAEVCGFGTREDQTVCLEGTMDRLGQFNPTVGPERCESLTDWRREVCQAAASRKKYDLEKSFALYQR